VAKRRIKIPKQIEASVLFDNDHTCCICMDRGKDVQINHIDEDPGNNNAGNLAVLCLDCHSKVTGTRGLGKKYSELEVKKYKRHWEYVIRKRRKLATDTHLPARKTEREILRLEIKKNVYTLTATQNLTRAREILDLLDTFTILEGNESYVLRQLSDVAPFLRNNAALVAEYVPHYYWGLPGPGDVKIRRHDTQDLEDGIELLRWIAELGTFGAGSGQIKASLRALYDLFQTANSYKLDRLTSRIVSNLRKLKKELRKPIGLSKIEASQAIAWTDSYLAKITNDIQHSTK
jgi:hypothetical protein